MIKRRSYEALWLLETGLRPRRFAKALTPSLLQIRLAASAPSAVAGRLSFSGSMLAHGRPGWAAKKSGSFFTPNSIAKWFVGEIYKRKQIHATSSFHARGKCPGLYVARLMKGKNWPESSCSSF